MKDRGADRSTPTASSLMDNPTDQGGLLLKHHRDPLLPMGGYQRRILQRTIIACGRRRPVTDKEK